MHIEAAGGAALLAFAVAALILSNSSWADAFLRFWEFRIELRFGELEFGRSLQGWINDGLMTLFFFLVALELKREAILGEMRNPRMAALSIAAALGGTIVPAAIYSALQWKQASQHGWGNSHGHRYRFLFMLFLSIVDDIGAILVVALGYSAHLNWYMLTLAGLGITVLRILSSIGIRSVSI